MLRVTYIGEAIAAQGFRLLGADTLVPEASHNKVLEAVHSARDGTDLILLDQQLAEIVHAEVRELLAQQPAPPILVVPGMAQDHELAMPALARARRELGIGA